MQSSITELLSQLKELNTTTGDELTSLGISLDTVISGAEPSISVLLTPLPGVPVPKATPLPTSGPSPPGSAQSGPAARVRDPHEAGRSYFSVTGHTLGGVFLDYWQQQGGLQQFGYPITEEFQESSSNTGKAYLVQYFERVRFEYHPENPASNRVVLGLLGSEAARRFSGSVMFEPASPQQAAGTVYFPETHHNVPPQFLSYWRVHGGQMVYGYPISEAFNETNSADGKTYFVQYFERARLEMHPEMAPSFRVSLGLLGDEVLRALGMIP
jgi:hypothetical protein